MTDEDLMRSEQPSQTPTMRELATVLFRQRRVFVWVWALVMAGAVFYLVAGSRYRAEMKLLVRPGRADSPASAQENAPLDLTRLALTEEDLNSEVDLLQDDEILRKVADESGLSRKNWLSFLRWNETATERAERAARRLARRLEVDPVKKTNLITVKYAADDPVLAARVLQALSAAYLEKHAQVHRPEGELPFFAEQTRESRQLLSEAQHDLLQFMSEHSVVAAATERDLALQRVSAADVSYKETRAELAEVAERMQELRAQLAMLPERTTTQVRSADNGQVLAALKSSLLALQVKRIELATKFEPAHPLVREVDEQIVETEAAINKENTAPLREETTDKNQHYEWAKSELEKAEVQSRSLRVRASELGAQLVEYQVAARQMGEAAVTQDDLVNSERAAEQNYLLYVKKQEEARMADALDRRGIVNVALAEAPVVPALPLWSTLAVLILGTVAAGTAGTAAAFAADRLDSSFRTPDDVLLFLQVPVLASLPLGFNPDPDRGSLPA